MKNKYLALFLCMLLLFTVFISGCQKDPQEESKKQVFVYGTAQEPGTLNPDAQDEPYGFSIYQNVYNRLVKCTNTFEIVPDLATSWEFSADGLSLTFHLNDNVRWHDGKDFSSADVKWTIETIQKSHGYMEAAISSIKSVDCPDENTVILSLTKPDSSLLSTLSRLGVFIMPKHIYEGTDWLENAANFAPVGTGPFKFVEWTPGESVRLERNNDYFGTKPLLNEVVFKFIPDENTAYLSWLNGEIDWYDSYPAEEVEKLKNDSKYVIVNLPTANVTYITVNVTDDPFTDVAVRKAILLSVDRNEIIEKAYHGVGTACKYFLPSIYSNYMNDSYALPSKNISEARKILEDAGYVADAEGMYLTIDFEYFSLDNFEDIATILKQQLAEAGINLQLHLIEYATWQERVFNNRDFSMTLMSGNQRPTIFSTIDRYNPDSATCISGYNSDAMRSAVNTAIATTNTEATYNAFSEIQKLLSEDIIIIPIAEKIDQIPLRANIHGHPLNEAISYASADELTYVYFSD